MTGFLMPVAAIIVAAGRGSRAGGEIPKQYRNLAEKPVVTHALRTFLAHPLVGAVLPVIHGDDGSRFAEAASLAGPPSEKLRPPVPGGATRQDSVRRGLEALTAEAPDLVLVHDAARPFVTPDLVDRSVAAGRAHGAAVPGIPVTDTVKVVDPRGRVIETPDRARLRAVQTPQAFAYPALLDAHRRAARAGLLDFSDDGALAEWAGDAVPYLVSAGLCAGTFAVLATREREPRRRAAAERSA